MDQVTSPRLSTKIRFVSGGVKNIRWLNLGDTGGNPTQTAGFVKYSLPADAKSASRWYSKTAKQTAHNLTG